MMTNKDKGNKSIATLESIAADINNYTNSNNLSDEIFEEQASTLSPPSVTPSAPARQLHHNLYEPEYDEPESEILPDFMIINFDDLEFYERCGKGTYGCVYRAHWKSRNKEVAVKKLLQLDNEASFMSY